MRRGDEGGGVQMKWVRDVVRGTGLVCVNASGEEFCTIFMCFLISLLVGAGSVYSCLRCGIRVFE